MTMGRIVIAANQVTIGGFWKGACEGRAEDEKNSRDFEIIESLLGKGYMARVFYAKDTKFEAFVQELLNMR